MTDEKKLSLFEHLSELRKYIFYALIGLVICIIVSFIFIEYIIEILTAPVGGLDNLQAIEVTESISVYMKISLLSGFILSFPWIFFQLSRFVLPALKPNEKRWIFTAIPFATILFISGVLFAFYVMIPPSLEFLTNLMGIKTFLRAKSYFNFIVNLIFWVGVCFEFPLIIYLLARLGILSSKFLIKGWRVSIVIIAILAAVITPTGDPINMALLMVPLIILYIISIFLAILAGKRRKHVSKGV